MKSWIIIFLGGIFTISCFSQSDVSKDLIHLSEIKAIKDPIARDTQLIWKYSYISEELARHQDVRTEAYLDTLETMAKASTWDMGMGLCFRAKARYHDFAGDYEPVLEYYQQAIDELKNANGDLKELAFTYVLKGFFLSNSGLHQECWKTLEEGLPYAHRTSYKNSLCLMLDWFGDYYFYGLDGEQDNEKALDYYLQVNEILPQISYHRIIADNYAVLSGTYERLDQLEKSDKYYQLADSLTKEWDLPHVRWGLLAEKARILEANSQFQEANIIYLKAKEFMDSSPNIEFKARLEEVLWENYKNLGNFEKALEHHLKLTEMNSQMAVEGVEKKYIEIETKYNIALKENQIQSLQESKLKSNRNLLLLLLSISLISGIIIWKKNKSLSLINQDLEKSKKQIKKALYKGETQERKRIASELHDNVNTTLAAARWRLEAINEELPDSAKEIVVGTIDMVNQAYQDVRNISHNLVPAELENKGLIGSIENLIIKINDSSRVQFKLEGEIEKTSLIQDISYPIYNIVFELINNILKHAEARNAKIQITQSDNNIVLVVRDDGQGYDPAKTKKGFGLQSIVSRVESLGGNLTTTSILGNGCISKITIPMIG